MIETLINKKWKLLLPPHKAFRPGWDWWESSRLNSMYQVIRPNDIIIDVGAEEGDLSTLYMTWGAKVIAIEPSIEYFPMMAQISFENNERLESMLWGFACNEDGKPEVVKYKDMLNEQTKPDHGFKHLNEDTGIPKFKLDNLKLKKIDIITIDTEGSEFEVIKGADYILKTQRPILFISIHPEFMRTRYNQTPDDLKVHLGKLDYVLSYLGYDHEEHYLAKPI